MTLKTNEEIRAEFRQRIVDRYHEVAQGGDADVYLVRDVFGLENKVDHLEQDIDALKSYARELAEEWVPDEWRGREGWRIRRVQEKHGVRHLFED